VAAMKQIANWLNELGLGQYAQSFAENGIDLGVLRDLTDQDLKDLGVLLGHRRKLLRAINEFGAGASITAKESSRPAASAQKPAIDAGAERRQLTVVFCDLVGSTALSARLDPEDMREVIGAYHKCVAETVGRFDGFVAKYMGDGVLVYFGYPQAHEDDAERAVRAGLDLIAAVGALTSSATLKTRVGIATGLVVVGDLIGSGEAQERGIVGETPNLAARLQAITEPNTVLIAEATRRLLGNLFEFRDLGPQELKGIAGFARAWVALRPSPIESRFEALHAGTLTQLVGREEETDILVRRWQRAKSREGQVALLSGEPGIGKSRLTAWLLERIAGESHTRLRYFCSPQLADSALHPIIGQLERAAGFKHDDDPRSKLDKLDAVLSRTSTSSTDAALLADLLSLPGDGRYPALDLSLQQRRQKTLEALTRQVETLASTQPVLMIFEDAHWTDPTSLETLSRTIDRIRTLPVFLIVTFRPEFDPPWSGQPNVTTLTLSRLGRREVGGMIERIVGNKILPADIITEIVERTDGVPLFVEEMTKAVIEAGEGGARHIASAVPSAGLAVPATLHSSLMARLDRLGSAKDVAQIGAALGREFSYELIAAVSPLAEKELEVALDRLKNAGLVFRQGAPPHATFLFKHALIQDAAYSTLLREPRRDLHARIAKALTEKFPEAVETRPEILAHHYTQAGLIEQAASLWGAAGQRSIARSSLTEAVTQLTRALTQLASLPETAARRRDEMKFQAALASGLMLIKGYSSPDAIGAFEKARSMIQNAESLGDPLEDPLLQFSVMYGLWVSSYVAINVEKLRERAEEFLGLAEKANASAPLQIGHRLMATTQFMLGHFRAAQTHADRAVLLYVPREHRPLAVRFGQDIGATALAYRAWALWHLGYPETALKDANELVKNVRSLAQAATLMHALYHASLTEIWARQIAAARAHSEELIALAEEKGAQFWRALGILYRGWILSIEGRAQDAIETINMGLDAYRSTGSRVFVPIYLSALARALANSEQFDRAWATITEALDAVQRTGERWAEAEIHRMAGELVLSSPEPGLEQAEAHFCRSLTIAREQEARSYELRTAISLARLWRDRGKCGEARDLLAPVYNWFTEGFDTLDLKDAKALLDELA
jgi:predicted ATPase/class 3 adenylate cyclase